MIRDFLALLLLLSTFGCATTGATVGSGVGERHLAHPPYYAGAGPGEAAVSEAPIGYLPIVYQRGATDAPMFDPPPGGAMVALLAEMNAYLDSLLTTVAGGGGTVLVVRHDLTPPDVQFGCATTSGIPEDDCALDGDTLLGRESLRMRLAVGRPSPEWAAQVGDAMAEAGVHRTLVITLEVGQYLVRQRGLRGSKEVELGTSYVQPLPWLTSLETPVAVLQLAGATVDPDGKAIRAGAEGLFAHRTQIRISALGGQEVITDEDVQALRVHRRDDLPGSPMTWKVGLKNLVEGLIGEGGDSR